MKMLYSTFRVNQFAIPTSFLILSIIIIIIIIIIITRAVAVWPANHLADGQVMVKWLAGQTAVLTARVRSSLVTLDCRFSVQCKVIALLAFYDAVTGQTEFIISIVSSVKIVNMP